MHLTAKIQQSYISLSSVNCDASLHTVNLKNVKETSFRLVQKKQNHEIIANQPLAALTGSAFSRSLNRVIGKQKYTTNGR